MQIDNEADAKVYLEAYIACIQRDSSQMPGEEARKIALSNLGYYAGYYNRETQARVERLFGAVHPIFGPVGGPDEPKTAEEAYEMGCKRVEEMRARAEEEVT